MIKTYNCTVTGCNVDECMVFSNGYRIEYYSMKAKSVSVETENSCLELSIHNLENPILPGTNISVSIEMPDE